MPIRSQYIDETQMIWLVWILYSYVKQLSVAYLHTVAVLEAAKAAYITQPNFHMSRT